jgi:fumarylacetoacetase
LPNWLHIPVGYHGRSSSIVVSGTNMCIAQWDKPRLMMPMLQLLALAVCSTLSWKWLLWLAKRPILVRLSHPRRLKILFLESPLFNDLSARDIQKWEYVPLGPFLSKNFGSVISPWIVTLDAFEPFRTNSPEQNPEPLPYLKTSGKNTFDIDLEVFIQPENAEETKVCHSNFKHLYWSMSQQLAHHTVNGCNINVGDMMASGTISGPTPDSYGSMMEISWKGTKPLKMNDGSERKFILDNDTIIMRGYAEKDGVKIGFGDCITKVLPANNNIYENF